MVRGRYPMRKESLPTMVDDEDDDDDYHDMIRHARGLGLSQVDSRSPSRHNTERVGAW
jgi:hypothetical protein